MKEDATGNLFSIYVQVKLSIDYITLLVFISLFLLIRPVRKNRGTKTATNCKFFTVQ